MRRVVLVLACIVLVMASVGTVAAQQSYTVHVPVVVVDSVGPWTPTLLAIDGIAEMNTVPIPGTCANVSSDCADPLSIVAPTGVFGDPTSEYSIANPDGRFGNLDSPDSAYNPEAAYPPYLSICPDDGLPCQFIAHVSENPRLSPRIDPDTLLAYYRHKSGCW